MLEAEYPDLPPAFMETPDQFLQLLKAPNTIVTPPFHNMFQVWERDTGAAMFADADMTVASACTVSADSQKVVLSCVEDTSGQGHSDPGMLL